MTDANAQVGDMRTFCFVLPVRRVFHIRIPRGTDILSVGQAVLVTILALRVLNNTLKDLVLHEHT